MSELEVIECPVATHVHEEERETRSEARGNHELDFREICRARTVLELHIHSLFLNLDQQKMGWKRRTRYQ